MKILIHNARLIDPDTNLDAEGYVTVENNHIKDVTVSDDCNINKDHFDRVIDAQKMVLCPALIDIFVGVGEPGGHHRETFESLSNAALSSGVGTVMIDPDTSPILDTPSTVDYALSRAKQNAKIHISVAAALSKNLDHEEMSQFGLLKDADISCVTSGDYAVPNSLLLHRSLSYASAEDLIVAIYPDDMTLSGAGIAHDGFLSSLYGLDSIPAISEQIGLMRDIALAKDTGAKLHIRGISSKESLPIIEQAKNENVNITVSVSSQHIALNEHDIIPYKSFFKMRPPLRTEEDRHALSEAVASGLIDMVTSQHRPRNADSKRLPYSEADSGCSAIETLLPIMLELYHKEQCSFTEALRPVTSEPAKRFNLEGGFLQSGQKANLILIDLDRGYKLSRDNMMSNASNTPYEGRLMQGICKMTMIDGQIEYES